MLRKKVLVNDQNIEVGYVFPMVISSEFHMCQYRDDDHGEDLPTLWYEIGDLDT